jgi:hypothetical protein
MGNTTEGKNDLKENTGHDPVESGNKAIEADRIINKKDQSEEEKDREAARDAEQWRNEG